MRKALHDLQQPLNVIRLASGNIRQRLEGKLPAQDGEYLAEKLNRIDEQVIRAARQIEGILAMVKASE